MLSLPGHKGSVWGLDVSLDGSFCLTVGQDRTLRSWARGEDLVFVEEERERVLEAQADRAAGSEGSVGLGQLIGGQGQGDDEGDAAVLLTTKKGIESVKVL